AVEIFVIFFVKDFDEVVHAEHDADHGFRVASKVAGEAVVFGIIGDENVETELAKDVDPGEKIGGVDHSARKQVVHSNFHENDHFFALDFRFGRECFHAAFEHVEIDRGDGAETAALHQNRFFIK